MAKVSVSKEFRFEAAHWIIGHPGKCARLHGHSYRVVVSVEGEVDDTTGMVIDYYDLKKAIEDGIGGWDHSLLTPYTFEQISELWETLGDEPILHTFGIYDPSKVIAIGCPTTAENLCRVAAREIGRAIECQPKELKWTFLTVRIDETATSSAVFVLDRYSYVTSEGPAGFDPEEDEV